MISLAEYKQRLVNFYYWPIDARVEEIEKRKKIIDEKYSDEYLEKIISDTNSFVHDVLSSETVMKYWLLNFFKRDDFI